MVYRLVHEHLPTISQHWRTVFYGLLLMLTGVTGGLMYAATVYQPISTAATTVNAATEAKPTVDHSFRLVVPKLGIDAPIIRGVSGTDEKAYLKAIENGVAQMDGTSFPDTPGTMFVFGHSSYYKTKPGNYKEVFKRLNELQAGDRFTVWYQDTEYTYEVFDSKIVSDADWSILKPTSDAERTMTLMTCWPPGTLAKRYVVHAKQVR